MTNNRKPHNICAHSARGFTLLELMISIAILSFLSIGVYKITSRTFDLREKLEQEGDFYNSARTALDIIRRDIMALYTPQLVALPGVLGQPFIAKAGEQFDPGYATEYWGQRVNLNNVAPSRFQGSEEKISFVTNNHIRLYQDTQEAEFSRIKYTLEPDDAPPQSGTAQADLPVGKVLTKYEDAQDATNANETVRGQNQDNVKKIKILSQVKSLKFRFLEGQKDQWFTSWDSEAQETKGLYPAMIEITMEVYPPLLLKHYVPLSLKFVVRPEQAL